MKHTKDFVLETLHFKLRYPSRDDIPAIFKASQVSGFTDGMRWSPPQNEDELIKPYEENTRAWAEGSTYCFSIVKKDNDEFLGRISIRRKEDAQKGIWDLGFFIIPQHQSKGHMTEALRAILTFGFNELDANKIEASYALSNKASERVLQKNGMTQHSHLSDNSDTQRENGFMKDGKWVEQNTLSITQLEWNQLNATNLE